MQAAARRQLATLTRCYIDDMDGLVCIRHQPSAPLGIVEDVLEQERVPYTYCDAWACEDWPEGSDVSGLVVLGGEMNADQIDRYPFLARVRSLMAGSVAAGKPVLGICLGSQLLARAFDAPVRPSPVPEAGFRRVTRTPDGSRDPVLSVFDEDVPVFQFHEDAFDLPHGATLLHRGEEVPNQSFRVGTRAYGVQFHFEVTEREISAWADDIPPAELRQRWGTSKEELLAQAEVHLPAQQRAAREAVRRFLRLMREVPVDVDPDAGLRAAE